ncbi:hypothetical protein [Oceanobacillus iheyensis HTE831]|uniref:DUF5058 domain-containing protein n=1 Tax=Oceanobacillus iheyensis (strain DSM 14371 / CIP 107618 / JCM 11309 / KCTC 3954 / HTE831) TaxID=221109 RepID=Q8CV06_OCEIH|nr:DUF5058 family protein [Oceanobacillus iheyensis]BAC12907.1 hypothetical protein [Oceanobacillus iheyensis HTE831]
MEATMTVANSPIVWLFAFLVISVVAFQGIKFIFLALKTSPSVGMTKEETKSAIKVGAINAIGPSLGIIIVAISLIALLGEPLTLMRIGIIGSAGIEATGAQLATSSAGVDLGTSAFTNEVFTLVVWVLCLGGIGWLLVVTLFTKSLGKMQAKIVSKNKNKQFPIMIILSTAAMLGIFSNFVMDEMVKGVTSAAVIFASAIAMILVSLITKNIKKLKWLNEYSLGISIIVGLSVSFMMF